MPAAIADIIKPGRRDLGGFEVARVLPSARRRMVGPFVFFDHAGPATFPPGQGVDVRPHPHIGLATVSYLLEGSIVHRDSLGVVQSIVPGDVNWMTAGRGIVHSERTGEAERVEGSTLHLLQSWIALPKAHEETEPAFHHHPAATLPTIERPGVAMRLIAGTAFGETSPVETFSPMFYLDAQMDADAALDLPPEHEERAAYIVDGTVAVDGEAREAMQLLLFEPGEAATIEAKTPARVMLLGGAPMDGPRHIWWNFVSSSKERIEQAKQDWKNGRFAKVPDESEFIPLPDK